jgi:hypothetical protein
MLVLVKSRSHKPGTDEWRNGRGKVMRVGRCETDLNMKICAPVSANCNIFLSFSSQRKCTHGVVLRLYMAKSHEVQVAIPTYLPTYLHMHEFAYSLSSSELCIIANCVWRALMFSVGLWQWFINIIATLLGLIHRPVFYLKHDVSDTDYSVCWAQLTRFHLKKETESSLRNVVSNKRQDDG